MANLIWIKFFGAGALIIAASLAYSREEQRFPNEEKLWFNNSLSACSSEIANYKRLYYEFNKNFHFGKSGVKEMLEKESNGKINGFRAGLWGTSDTLSFSELQAMRNYYLGSAKRMEQYINHEAESFSAENRAGICVSLQMSQLIADRINSGPTSGSSRPPAGEMMGVDNSRQMDVNQSIALAQQNQAHGDEQARKKGRREHRPDLDAKECLQFNPNTRLIRNACSYQIEVSYCAHNPKEANNNNFDVTWAFSCTEGKGRFGASTLRPGKDLSGMFPHRADGGVYVAACREVYPKDIKFTGNQIDYRCRPI